MLDIPPAQSWQQRLKLPLMLVAIGLATVILVVVAIRSFSPNSDHPVPVAMVEMGDITATVSAYGRLLPRQSSSVIAEVDGTVIGIERYPGSEVKPGDVIFKLRNPNLERQREQAELAVLEAKAAKESVEANLIRDEIAIQSDIEMVKSELRFAARQLETMGVLLEQAILAKLDYLQAETTYEQAQLRLKLFEQRLAAFQRTKQADQNSAEYRLQEAQKKLAMAEYDIAQLAVRAEHAGLLNSLEEAIEMGSSVQRGRVMAQITDPNSLYADLLVSANEAARIAIGQPVEVNIRGDLVRGEVLRIHPSAQNNQIRLEVLLPQELPQRSRANLDIAAKVITATAHATMRVQTPLYVTPRDSTVTVYVQQGDTFQQRTVELGVIGQDYSEVRSGLQQSEWILLDVPADLREQSIIQIKELNRG